jgi:hypothetical protein
MAATGVPPGDMVIALAFMVAVVMGASLGDKGMALAFGATAAGAAMFIGGEVGVYAIVGVARTEMGLINCANTKVSLVW